jgi:hypothetical protein
VYSLAEAAEAVGRGKPALIKAIQKGRISATRNEKGEWLIDPAELHRVYPPTKSGTAAEAVPGEREEAGGELAALRQVIATLERQIIDLQAQRDDWKAERDRLLGMIESHTRVLTDQRSWWQRLKKA